MLIFDIFCSFLREELVTTNHFSTMKAFPWVAVTVLLAALSVSHLASSDDNDSADDGFVERVRRQAGSGTRALTPADLLMIICHELQDLVPICSSVPTIPGGTGPTRKKRSYKDLFNQNFPTPPPFPSIGSSSSSSSSGHNFGDDFFGGKENVTCPTQEDVSAAYNLSSDSVGYPVVAIATEVSQDLTLFNCLLRTVVLVNTPPSLSPSDALENAKATCSFEQRRLFSYFSVKANTSCFFLQNFQENLLYRNCLNSTANQCEQKNKDYFGFHYNPFHPTNTTRTVNKCFAEYERASIWSYCPDRPAGTRIIWDRIIVPKACVPFSVTCNVTKTGSFW